MPSDSTDLVVERGKFHAYFFYDVADTLDLAALGANTRINFQKAKVEPGTAPYPGYVQFVVPPLAAALPSVEIGGSRADVQLKAYDYGTMVIRFTFDLSGAWTDFSARALELHRLEALGKTAEKLLTEAIDEVRSALNKPHKWITADYYVMEVESFGQPITSQLLLTDYRSSLASLLLCESRKLSTQEEDEALRVHFSYFDRDLVVVHWETAFIFDTREGAEAVLNIMEFAHTQLVELCTYDQRLDSELDEIYKWDIARQEGSSPLNRRTTDQQLARLRYLLVDIRELSDRSNNALKVVGDAFYARLYRATATRLGVPDYQREVDSKLSSVGEIYRLTTDRAQHARSYFLEVIVIVLIAVEIVIGLIEIAQLSLAPH